MQDNTLQKFDELRSQILNELVPLIDHTSGDPAQKYNLLLAVARSSGEPERFMQAFEAAKKLETPDDKAAAYLDLLDVMEDITTALAYPDEDQAPVDEATAPEASQPIEHQEQ